jgi:chorismate synthase
MEIRQLSTAQEYRDCEETMKKIWEFTDRDIIPSHVLKPIQDQGGLVLGAFEDNEMVGVLVGFLGYYKGVLHHHSHVTGVLTRYKEIGYQLKQRQREFALSQGLDLVTWTFDPLQSSNAYFNFAKLGVVSNVYHRDYYGEMRDGLNIGLSSDRLLVEWRITSENVLQRVKKNFKQPKLDEIDASIVNKTEKDVFRTPGDIDLELTHGTLLVEIPSDINVIKTKNIECARTWRKETRGIFETYFAKGYTACNVISEFKEGERRTFYVLRKDYHENQKN